MVYDFGQLHLKGDPMVPLSRRFSVKSFKKCVHFFAVYFFFPKRSVLVQMSVLLKCNMRSLKAWQSLNFGKYFAAVC